MTTFNIIAHAQALTPALLQKLKGLKNTLALDGMATDCLHHNIIPDFVCGDFDSIAPQTLETLQQLGCQLKHYPDQNYSDLEKGIFWCDDMGASSIRIFNALGGLRPDHTILNYRILKKHYKPARTMVLEEEAATLQYITNQRVSITGKTGALASIMAYPQCWISSKGLGYDMQDYELSFAKAESCSNHLAEPEAIISVKGDALFVLSNEISALTFLS